MLDAQFAARTASTHALPVPDESVKLVLLREVGWVPVIYGTFASYPATRTEGPTFAFRTTTGATWCGPADSVLAKSDG